MIQKPLLKKDTIVPFPSWAQAKKRRCKLEKDNPSWRKTGFAFGGIEFKNAKVKILENAYRKRNSILVEILFDNQPSIIYTMLVAEMIPDNDVNLFKKSILTHT
jgi:hypothetical protein